MLALIDVHSFYGDSHILRGVSLEIQEGCVVALVGRNGMGKTTLLHSVIGFVPPRKGVIRFMDQDIAGCPPHKIARMGIGLVPQGRRIFHSLTVRENMTMSARGVIAEGAWNLEKIYALFPILRKRTKYKGNRLSGGEQQMLTIARALMTNPTLLLMDEPSEGLAPIIVREIRRIIARLKEGRLSILLVEQNIPLALGLADFVHVISKGEIVYRSTPQELGNNEDIMAQHLGV